ncbi:hypothetical protein N7G274_010363 [Stereocaulon virgatum]|uniref:Uncharacterized protein n=1 Tax=Stereocaulon virgatum TaxID=373712 RepID=A0ABR4A0T8_9LECA
MCCQKRTPRCTTCHRRPGCHRRNCLANPRQLSSSSTSNTHTRQISSPSDLRPLSSFHNIPEPQPQSQPLALPRASRSSELPPSYHAAIDPQPETSTLFPAAVPGRRRCGGGEGYGKSYGQGVGERRNNCRGPVNLLVGYFVKRHQEKKERENGSFSEEGSVADIKQEQGIVESIEKDEEVDRSENDEKKNEDEEEARYIKKEEDERDVKDLTSSVRSMSS